MGEAHVNRVDLLRMISSTAYRRCRRHPATARQMPTSSLGKNGSCTQRHVVVFVELYEVDAVALKDDTFAKNCLFR